MRRFSLAKSSPATWSLFATRARRAARACARCSRPRAPLSAWACPRALALLTDGRFSGASKGPCVGHVSPEAAAGGPIALIEDGDQVTVDIEGGALDVARERRRARCSPRRFRGACPQAQPRRACQVRKTRFKRRQGSVCLMMNTLTDKLAQKQRRHRRQAACDLAANTEHAGQDDDGRPGDYRFA